MFKTRLFQSGLIIAVRLQICSTSCLVLAGTFLPVQTPFFDLVGTLNTVLYDIYGFVSI